MCSLMAVTERGSSHRVLKSPSDAAPSAVVTSTLEAVCTQVKDFLHTRVLSVVADDVTWEIIAQQNDKRFIYLSSESSHTKVVLRKFLAAILNPDVRNLHFSYTCNNIALFLLCELQAAPNLNCLKSRYTKNITGQIFGKKIYSQWAAIAQSVQRLATGWTVRGSKPGGGEIFRICTDRP